MKNTLLETGRPLLINCVSNLQLFQIKVSTSLLEGATVNLVGLSHIVAALPRPLSSFVILKAVTTTFSNFD